LNRFVVRGQEEKKKNPFFTQSRNKFSKDTSYQKPKRKVQWSTFSNIREDLWTFPMREIIDLRCRRLTTAIFSSSSTTWSSSCLRNTTTDEIECQE
jgi:hypothetical protein